MSSYFPSLFTGQAPFWAERKFSDHSLQSSSRRGGSVAEPCGVFSTPARTVVEGAPGIDAKFALQEVRTSQPHHRVASALSLEEPGLPASRGRTGRALRIYAIVPKRGGPVNPRGKGGQAA